MKRVCACAAVLVVAAGCNERQSALAPFGREAGSTLSLTVFLAAAASCIALAVFVLSAVALRAPPGQVDFNRGLRIILWLGAVFPTLALALLLAFSLPMMRPLPAPADALRIEAVGEQFWWRLRYHPAGGQPVEAANELRLPVGRPVVIELTAADVIHSFWVPGLAGKMDMLPGRTNRLVVEATRPGRYRGACSEFCGLGHALMLLDVVAAPPDAFDAWLAAAAGPASASAGAHPGRDAFVRWGCGGCHTVRGHGPAGGVGPDLTRLGERRSLAAASLPMTAAAIAAFVRDPAAVKPGAAMPAFPQIPPADLDAIAAYLLELR